MSRNPPKEYQKALRSILIKSHKSPRGIKKEGSYIRQTKSAIEFKYKCRGEMKPEDRGTRGAIHEFTGQSRKRMSIMMGNLENAPLWWHTFTFADDVMAGKTLAERVKFSSRVLKNFKKRVERKYPGIEAIWRREIEPRKSGMLKGEYCPHFHIPVFLPGITRETFTPIAADLLRMWIEQTGTKDIYKAVLAHCDPDRPSIAWLDTEKMAQLYISKYSAKIQDSIEGGKVSLGRMWGTIGNPKEREPEEKGLGELQGYVLKRTLRKLAKSQYRSRTKKGKGAYKGHKRFLKNITAGATWMMVKSETIDRIFEYMNENNVPPF